MSYNILVTGGIGYLGSTMVSDLLAASHKGIGVRQLHVQASQPEPLCLPPRLLGSQRGYPGRRNHRTAHTKGRFIIPLADLVGVPLCNLNPVGTTTVNHDTITLMLKLLSKDQIVLMPTTNSAYGTRDDSNYCNEESPLRLIS